MSEESTALPWPLVAGAGGTTPTELMARVARGDSDAFAQLYDQMVPRVYGLIRRVLRNPAQSEEVTQEVMVEVWRTCTRYDADRGSPASWILTMAHRRAIDRVRSEQSSTDREQAMAAASATTEYDEVAEAVTSNLEVQQVRNCLSALTELQRESVTLAYYGGYSYREVAELLDAKLATIKARMRDGLIRLRDCLGVTEK
ncbi:RNA polymerase, sigma-24 subunit, ECF subfamily [Kribbella flavida DSM 17836]|uniref:RNA polymerase, sigma-24 subunit, ECF subfamily n=1 Tax=Kribbella flavida (strain DSM 17836 / JCM 10339 / NBRC 14399) TaxID=479435 RepID=D2PP14_KRIFD|nr:sigma-70 family RNA polymerase sigma factor [Kribbella flavida]ADB32832.1 RNA polymerase, sigma-24 subunit, ECF subfamily [Kribbella flavida DSM 17836]